MLGIEPSGTFTLGDRTVKRLGYGHATCRAWRLRPAQGSRHGPWPCCASRRGGRQPHRPADFYGPHITNGLIREALHPYPEDLVIVTKIGARRGDEGSWIPALSPNELIQPVHDNLRNLRLDVLAWSTAAACTTSTHRRKAQ